MVPLYTASAAAARLFLRTVILSLQNQPDTKINTNQNLKNFPVKLIPNFLLINPFPIFLL